MGHGDEIVLTDSNFPASSIARKLVRADGVKTAEMLEAILKLIPLDQYDENHFVLMEKVKNDNADTSVWNEYEAVVKKYSPNTSKSFEERFAFYERAKKAYCVVACSENRQYANIILKKGCII